MKSDEKLHSHFRLNGFGNYVLQRNKVIAAISAGVKGQLATGKDNSTGVFLSGCRGMGKTSLLHLVASDLKSNGYEVYFYNSADRIPLGAGDKFLAFAKQNPDKQIAVLIDEVHSKPSHNIFVTLLKDAPPNILTIGAAVARYEPSNVTCYFRTVLLTSDLVLNGDDEDIRRLIEHWKDVAGKNGITPEMVEHVSSFLLEHCGGHVYPVLAFMEHFFVHVSSEQASLLSSEIAFAKHFYSPEFAVSDVSKSVRSRCFGELNQPESAEALARVVGGTPRDTDITNLTRLGWWLLEKNSILSTLMLNTYLLKVKVANTVILKEDESPRHNLELLISTGLKQMTDCQLTGSGNVATTWPIENALSFSWATNARAHIPNVHMEFQAAAGGGWVDFYVNGRIDTALEVIRNATRTVKGGSKGASTDIDDHLERFTSGDKYVFNQFALLNFALKGDRPVLPRDKTHHDKVYTYVYADNALYRGNNCIRRNAVDMISSRRTLRGERRANYSTMTQRLAGPSSSVNLPYFPPVVVPSRARASAALRRFTQLLKKL